MDFSDEQKRAIDAEGCNYLISAGAGSGKTAVLTQRIYRIAKREGTLDNFLVLTFTNLAAAEMKKRVREKLQNDEKTVKLASEVDNAHIETFDSFYLYLAKKYFYVLGISKNPNIVDGSILAIKRMQFLDQVFDERCDAKEKGFVDLIASHCAKNANTIKQFILKLLTAADRHADKYQFLDEMLSDYFNQDIIDKAVKDFYSEIVSKIKYLREQAYKLEDADDATAIIDLLDDLLAQKDYDSLCNYFLELQENKKGFPRKKSKGTSDGAFRDSIKKFYDDKIVMKENSNYGNSKYIAEQYFASKANVEEIVRIAIEVEKRTDQYKKDHNAYSFPDISRFVLTLLKNESIRKEIRDSFDYIMIDEYQDTNSIQDDVIKAICKDNVYMVGDVKQSIYRFRGADCQIFQDKYEDYKLCKGGKEIDLNRSYRSREEVVDFINELFEKLMVKELNPIDYSNGHHFGFGREEYNKTKNNCSYQPEVYNFLYEYSAETADIESEIIAKDILNRINNRYEVFDKDNGSRPCDFKDFAIIIDRGSSFDTYRKTFAKYNIPLKVESKESLFKSDVVSVLRSLVKMAYYSLNNDYGVEYKHAYFSVARSFILEYDDARLYEIHKNDAYLVEPFAQKIELLKEGLRFASIKQMVLKLVEEFDIYASLSKITSFYTNTHKIENIISIAESIDSIGYTLEDFVKYFDDLQDQDIDMDYRDSDTLENSVTLLNIHASKGLEYTIVYYPGLLKEFNREEAKSSYLISNRYGIVLPNTEDDSLPSLLNHLVKEELKRSDFEEKIRLIYVAFTRAKEKIIILNGYKENESGLVRPNDSISFKQMLKGTGIIEKYSVNYQLDDVKKPEDPNDKEVTKITLRTLHIPATLVERRRASKEVDEEIDQSVLDFGTEVHAYLETMDLESDDLSYISDKSIRRYVKNVKESPLLQGLKNEDVRHEFPFIDEETNTSGYIDLLIIRDDEIDIVDFKLKNIDESEYDKQLRTYKKYVAKITDKKIRMFLLATITGEIREVEDE